MKFTHFSLITILFIVFTVVELSHGKASLSKESQLKKKASAEQAGNLHSGDALVPPGLLFPPGDFDGVPPGFEKVLPAQTLQQLRDLYKNQQIPLTQKQAEFDRIMSAVPSELLAKLPLPPGFETLSQSVQQKIRAIHGDPSLDWGQKHQKVTELIESLPADQRPRPPPGLPPHHQPQPNSQQYNGDFFPPNPPPGFEKVLPPDVYQRLLEIHQNQQLGWRQKSEQIDQIMRALPQHIIDRLPLPPGFDQLPDKYITQARAIFGDKTLNFHEKDQKVFKFVRSLPPELRKLVRPPLPPAFERLKPETKEKIAALFDDDSVDDGQRQKRFWKFVHDLPANERGQVEEALKFPA